MCGAFFMPCWRSSIASITHLLNTVFSCCPPSTTWQLFPLTPWPRWHNYTSGMCCTKFLYIEYLLDFEDEKSIRENFSVVRMKCVYSFSRFILDVPNVLYILAAWKVLHCAWSQVWEILKSCLALLGTHFALTQSPTSSVLTLKNLTECWFWLWPELYMLQVSDLVCFMMSAFHAETGWVISRLGRMGWACEVCHITHSHTFNIRQRSVVRIQKGSNIDFLNLPDIHLL